MFFLVDRIEPKPTVRPPPNGMFLCYIKRELACAVCCGFPGEVEVADVQFPRPTPLSGTCSKHIEYRQYRVLDGSDCSGLAPKPNFPIVYGSRCQAAHSNPSRPIRILGAVG